MWFENAARPSYADAMTRTALLLVLASLGCGVEPPDRNREAVVETAPPVVDGNSRSALVRWSRTASDCPDDAVRPSEIVDRGTVTIEEDQLTMSLSTMPTLRGTVQNERAEITGVATFWVDEEVTCTVNGVAEMRSNLVVAQVSEFLTSTSSLNCQQDWTIEVEY